jgi:hypothetical protein
VPVNKGIVVFQDKEVITEIKVIKEVIKEVLVSALTKESKQSATFSSSQATPETENQILQQILKLAFYQENNQILQNDLIQLILKI